MSRALHYRRIEEQKRRFALYAIATVVFYMATLLVGTIAYTWGGESLSIYLSLEAATRKGGLPLFFQSLLALLSFIALVVSMALIFLAKSSTSMGEFSSSKKLIYAAAATTAVATAFAAAALAPPAAGYINEFYYIYLGMLAASLALSSYALTLLKGVTKFYTPRRK
ncbi:MAG: hypothetical protein ACK4SY_01860 [Pyrobaculum sp.]